jgi:hypothetical protein
MVSRDIRSKSVAAVTTSWQGNPDEAEVDHVYVSRTVDAHDSLWFLGLFVEFDS